MKGPTGPSRGEARRLVGDRHLGSEFLRLIVGARHQRHAGDAGREAEIVFDPRRRAGLAAERAAIEHEDRQSFRRRIDGRGKPGRSGTDNDDIVETVRDRSAAPGRGSAPVRPRRDCAAVVQLGHSTIGNCPGSMWKRSISAFAGASVSGLSNWCG